MTSCRWILFCLLMGLCSCSEKQEQPDAPEETAPANTNAEGQEPAEFSFEEFERQARREISQQTHKHNEKWGIGKSIRWDADLEEGIIKWTFPEKIVSAPVQVLFTYVPAEQSLMWSWNNTSVKEKLAKDSLKLKAWGEERNLSQFTTPEFKCSEAEAWGYAAIAAKVAEANGIYRGPSGRAFIFFAYGELSESKPDITPDFDLKE